MAVEKFVDVEKFLVPKIKKKSKIIPIKLVSAAANIDAVVGILWLWV
jgi:translation initiation factor 2 gamma subunit (eIF-2gamma)